MTEAEWHAENREPQHMVNFLMDAAFGRTKSGRRKFRLFACECCREAWTAIPDQRLKHLCVVAESVADGLLPASELEPGRHALAPLQSDSGPYGKSPSSVRVAVDMVFAAAYPTATAAAFHMTATQQPLAGAYPTDKANQRMCDMIRCIFGYRSNLQPFSRKWRTSTTIALAAAIYTDRAFDRLPILADALQEAGCEDAAILDHCRGPGPHVRGCWVVDLVLGKS